MLRALLFLILIASTLSSVIVDFDANSNPSIAIDSVLETSDDYEAESLLLPTQQELNPLFEHYTIRLAQHPDTNKSADYADHQLIRAPPTA